MNAGAGRMRRLPPLAAALLPLIAAAPSVLPLPIPPIPDPVTAAREALRQAERDRAAQLAQHQTAIARAASALSDQQRLSGALVAATARLQETEEKLARTADRMDELRHRQAVAEAALRARAADLAPLLPLIERLALHPVETLLAVPRPPAQTLAGVLVMRGLSHRLEQDAEGLLAEQRTVASLAGQIAAAATALAAARAAQRQQAAALDAQIAGARQAERTANDAASAAARQAAADAARAVSLRGLLARIAADHRAAEARAREEAAQAERQSHAPQAAAARARQAALAAPAGPGIASASGRAPVVGRLVRAFGAATAAGRSEGLSFATAPRARVVSPCAGRVEFAAPFRSYGRLLIVNCGGGYHLVLAGLDRLDVSVGRSVQAGTPVGVMPDWADGAAGTRPALYLELRRDGQPVDPAPWLQAKGSQAKG
jgi:septal ring factor EnvC (AmiA/AmiB activator)